MFMTIVGPSVVIATIGFAFDPRFGAQPIGGLQDFAGDDHRPCVRGGGRHHRVVGVIPHFWNNGMIAKGQGARNKGQGENLDP